MGERAKTSRVYSVSPVMVTVKTPVAGELMAMNVAVDKTVKVTPESVGLTVEPSGRVTTTFAIWPLIVNWITEVKPSTGISKVVVPRRNFFAPIP